MLIVAIDQRRDRRLAHHVDASPNQRIIRLGEVDNPRRLRDAAIEPWLHGMAVRGCHIGRLCRHQRADVI